MIRTRFAPSPTEFMHIDNLKAALFSYLIANQNNGSFLLRIGDTNQKRYALDAEEFIYKMMEVFHLSYDEGPKREGGFGPYIQSERLDIYKKYADYLVQNDYAYPCFCEEETLQKQRQEKTFMYDRKCRNLSKEEIQKKIQNKEKFVIRQKTPIQGTTSFHDEVYGDITFDNQFLEDPILIKKDGFPTYNFCNVVDDGLMQITHVVRENKFLSSMPKYIHLYDALDFDLPKFIHLPHTLNAKDIDLEYLLNEGYLPEAILNYVALLSFSPKTNQEIFTLEQLVKEFDIAKLHKKNSKYDSKKLQWFNKQYIREKTEEEYLKFITPFFIKNCDMKNKSLQWLNHLALLYKNRISYGMEIVKATTIFFLEDVVYEENCKTYLMQNKNVKKIVTTFKEEILKVKNWTIEEIESVLKKVEEKYTINKKDIYMPIRIAISGQMQGPNLVDTIYLIGLDKIRSRLE